MARLIRGLNQLHSFAVDLVRSRSERDAAQTACERLSELLGASTCQVLLRDEHGAFRVAGAWPGGRPVGGGAIADGIVGSALEAEVVLMESDEEGGELVALPLLGSGEPVGAIVCECPRPLDLEQFAAAEQAADLCAVSFGSHLQADRARRTATSAEALVELSAALGLQPTRQGTAELLCLAVPRLVGCVAAAVWVREPGVLIHAASHGYDEDTQRALAHAELPPEWPAVADALRSRRVVETVLGELPDLPLAPARAPAQSRVALVGVGERAGNRALVTLVRAPLAGRLSEHELRLLSGIQDQALLAFENRLLTERLERQAASAVHLH